MKRRRHDEAGARRLDGEAHAGVAAGGPVLEGRVLGGGQVLGVRVTQRRETPDGISAVSNTLVRIGLGGQERFVADLLEGMSQTLERIKAEVEA